MLRKHKLSSESSGLIRKDLSQKAGKKREKKKNKKTKNEEATYILYETEFFNCQQILSKNTWSEEEVPK